MIMISTRLCFIEKMVTEYKENEKSRFFYR